MSGRIKYKLDVYRGKRSRKNIEKGTRDMIKRVH